MATMDIIQLYGGEPANFLDIGGGASSKEVMDGFHIFNSDVNVSECVCVCVCLCVSVCVRGGRKRVSVFLYDNSVWLEALSISLLY